MATLTVALSGCGVIGSDDSPERLTLPVQVDGTTPDSQASLLSFFPQQTVVRRGDTVRFELDAIGEPHSIALGTLVDAGLAALDTVGPKTVKDAFLGEPEALYKLPSIFGAPPTYTPEPQAAGQPCFLESGDPPPVDACPKRAQPRFTGRQSFYASGLLTEKDVYRVALSDDIKPGTYRFMCLIHRGTMTGSLRVVDDDEVRPGPQEVREAGKAAVAAALGNLADPIGKASAATPAAATAGAPSSKDLFGAAMTFGPRDVSIRAGQSVSWSFYLCHTITFNPPNEAFGDVHRQPDGSVRLNPIAYTPAIAKTPPPLSFDPGAPPLRFDAGSWDGTGYFNSGGVCSLAPGDVVYELTFTKPGVHTLRCLFHPFMQARINVA